MSEWIEKNRVPFKVGTITGDEEKIRFAWGAVSLPHLILTDPKHNVVAEGLGLGDLEKQIEAAASR